MRMSAVIAVLRLPLQRGNRCWLKTHLAPSLLEGKVGDVTDGTRSKPLGAVWFSMLVFMHVSLKRPAIQAALHVK